MKRLMNIWILLAALLFLLTACSAETTVNGRDSLQVTGIPVSGGAVESSITPKEADPEEEDDALYDKEAYEAAVDAILSEYRALNEESLADYNDLAHPELPYYTAIVANTDRSSLYQGRWDFDENGVPELVIAVGDDTYHQPVALYAFNGQKMVYLCREQALGERAYLSTSGGLFFVRASDGAASGTVTVWRIAPDGFSTEIVEVVEYAFEDEETVTYTPTMGNMTVEEFTRYDTLQPFSIPVEYELFAPLGGGTLDMANPWKNAASEEEAAQGAGLSSFVLPEAPEFLSEGFEGPTFRYMSGLAEAIYVDGENRMTIRKGVGDEDVSGDYSEYLFSWEVDLQGLEVYCAGERDEVKLARWAYDGNAYSLSYNPGLNELPGLSESDVMSLISQIR